MDRWRNRGERKVVEVSLGPGGVKERRGSAVDWTAPCQKGGFFWGGGIVVRVGGKEAYGVGWGGSSQQKPILSPVE